MDIRCEAENLYPNIEKLINKLSDGKRLGKSDDEKLRKLLDKYWDIECPFEGQYCLPNRCSLANPETWIEYHGYTSMADLLWHFEYEEMDELVLKDKKSIDTLDAHWARRRGHYNP